MAPRLGKHAKVEKVKGDLDVFGDGSVTMLDLPGHTPGHHGLHESRCGKIVYRPLGSALFKRRENRHLQPK